MICTRSFFGAIALLYLSVSTLSAQRPIPNVNDGTALQRECGAALNQADNGPVTDPDDDDMERGSDMGQCLGLVTGVWHTHMMMVDDFGSREAFCATQTISAGQMARIVDAYLKERRPAELDMWDTVLILRAYVNEFPCR